MSAISASNAVSPESTNPVDVVDAVDVQHSPHTPLRLVPAGLMGVVVGAAIQLQQAALWSAGAYGALLLAAFLWAVGGAWVASRRRTRAHSSGLRWWARGLAGGAVALAMFALCGLRAASYSEQALAPALEGQDLRVTGVIAAMPQANEAGTRMRIRVETARLNGEPVRLPPLIDVAWYGGAFRDAAGVADLQLKPPALRAGERWEMTVRLKAPHGLQNPHGFDFELWMWEQGVQATGYVRVGPKDEAPVRVAATWQHPVEQARQTVRDAILDRLGRGADDADPARARTAGVVAALVTGDQRAIDRWPLTIKFESKIRCKSLILLRI
ncbi:MAG: ComEC/Rec2 family competence protein [Acidovorax sp.]|uniref:ComEC/Rec2 family competence protein n=1 Tax=Acidovorax sp. TaxID=1872122 RepID=UPI00391BA05A